MKKRLTIMLLVIMACAVFSSDVKLKVNYDGSTNDTAGFVIYYGPSSRNYTNSLRVGYVTNAVISNLPSNTSLYFSGRAIGYNDLESDLGNEILVVTTPPSTNTLPSSVKDFRVMKVQKTIY